MAAKNFRQQESAKWLSSLVVFSIAVLFWLVSVSLLILGIGLTFSIFSAFELPFWADPLDLRFYLVSASLGSLIGIIHYWDARYHGAEHIVEMLRALPPDPNDRYHQQYKNLVNEMAVASGLQRVEALVLPSHAINSMAIILQDGTPGILTSEGLLSECSRDEIQAAVAHELSHILSGDTFYVTMICSLASFTERLADELRPPDQSLESIGRRGGPSHGGAQGLMWIVFTISVGVSMIMRLLSTLISREREYLADARAVDFTRNPKALGTLIYKAQLQYSFMGDFKMSYSPLFIVCPQSAGDPAEDGFFKRVVATHPAPQKRMEKLAGMAYCTVPELMKLAWEQQKEREETRTQLCVSESSPEQLDSAPRHDDSEAERVYNIRSPKGEWMGPFTPAELITQAFFTSSILVHDTANDVRAPAREFLAILATIRGEAGSAGIGNCPNHHGKLKPISYEGVELLECPVCRGRAAKSRADVQKILVRRDVSFSPALVEKAKETQKNLMLNPAKKLAPFGGKALPESLSQQRSCPYCGGSMSQRPYNYQFFIPIDECLRCGGMWFDADELEILQILVEQKGTL